MEKSFFAREERTAALKLEIGSPDASARAFEYRSPLCAERFTGEVDANKVKFDGLAMFNGRNEDNEWWSGSSYIAQDCTAIAFSHSKFRSRERAEQILEGRVALASEIMEKRSIRKPAAEVFWGKGSWLALPTSILHSARSGYCGSKTIIFVKSVHLLCHWRWRWSGRV